METTHNVVLIPVEKIDSNPLQPRRAVSAEYLNDLRNSIAAKGLLEPIAVRSVGDRYQVIFGHQRVEAFRTLSRDEALDQATRAKFAQIPADVRENVDDAEMLELALTENIRRKALTPLEIADGLATLKQLKPNLGSVRTLAHACGVSPSQVDRFLDLAAAPACIREHLGKSLSVKHALELIRCHKELKATPGIPNPAAFADKRVGSIARMVRNQKWSTERTRRHVDRVLSGDFKGGVRKQSPVKSPPPKRAEDALAPKETSSDVIAAAAVRHWWTTMLEVAWAPYRYLVWFASIIVQLFGHVVSLGHAVSREWRHVRAMKANTTVAATPTSAAVPKKKLQNVPDSTPDTTEGPSKKAA